MAYVPKYKTEAEAASALDRGEATRAEKEEATYYQSYAEQKRALDQRLALGKTGAVARTGGTFSAGDVDVHAKFFADDPTAQFIEYEGGGVAFATPDEIAGLTGSGKPVFASGANETSTGQLALTPAEGKTIARYGQTVKNPTTGVDEHANEGEILIEYTDGTVERRQVSNIKTPGGSTPIGEFGRTADELGITRQTEIKGGEGQEVTRAPQSAAQVLQQMISDGAEPEAIDEFLQSEGQTSTADFQHIGKTYRGQTAKDGYSWYVDPKTKKIIQRPEALQGIAQPLTTPGVAGTKLDVVDKFRAVFGRDPNETELKYWLGRTDKVGSALIGAMQFAKQSGGAVGSQPGAGIADPVEALKATANAEQSRLAAAFSDAGITGKSDDKRALRAQIEALKPPETESLKDFTQDQLANSQMQEAMADLNRSKDALRQLDADYLSNIEGSERGERARGLTTSQVRRNQSEIDVAYNRSRRDLVAELTAHQDIVSSQTAIMGLMIDAFKYDSQAAQQDYANRFNKATQLYNMTVQDEQFAFTVQEKLKDNQRANLSVISGLIGEGRINYDNLSPEAKSQIAMMESAVGLTGLTQAIAKTPIPPVKSIGASITDEAGNIQTQIISQDPVTGELSISYHKAPFKEKKAAGSGSGSGDLFGGLAGLLGGVMGADSDWEIDSAGSSGSGSTMFEPPPMTGVPNSKMEYPQGSGVIWEADNKGYWI